MDPSLYTPWYIFSNILDIIYNISSTLRCVKHNGANKSSRFYNKGTYTKCFHLNNIQTLYAPILHSKGGNMLLMFFSEEMGGSKT